MFRLKIASLIVLISGTVLVAFGLFFLTMVGRVGIRRIDREILALGESQLHVWHPRVHWQEFDRSLKSIYGSDRWKDLIVQVTGTDNDTLYVSPHWPQEITRELFPDFEVKMAPPPPSDRSPGAVSFQHPFPDPPRYPPPRRNPPGTEDRQQGLPAPPSRPPPGPVEIKSPRFRTIQTPGGAWRTGIMGNQHITIMLGMDLAGFYEEARRYRNALLVAVPVALFLLAAGGWLIAHRALRPVAVITRTAEKITARGLDQRIPRSDADSELRQLIRVINSMLDRLEKSFGQAVRFSADAAHELQTPLTILQGALDDAVRHAASGSDEQRRYGSLLEEVGRLKSIVRKLLLLARADADQLQPRVSPVDFSAILASAAEDAGVIGPDLTIEQQIQPGVMVLADPDLLQMVIQGLTANAVKFNQEGGRVRFSLTVQNKHAVAVVSNTGALIPEQERDRIFERFYRLDPSRGGRVPGTGLGLSLAREIVRAHKGELRVEVSSDYLNAFVVSIPCQVKINEA